MKRRGLSTVVGAVFFVLVMASAIGYVSYSLNLIDDLARQVDVKQDTTSNRQNEEFKISHIRVDNNEFNLTVTNTGNIPINITRMWAKNTTDSSWNQTKYQLNQLVTPGQSVTNVGQGTGLVVVNSSSYLIKMVTSRGNSLNTQLLSASDQPLEMALFTAPSSPLSKQNVTLLYSVKNNLTEGKIIRSVVPDFRPPVTTGSATAVLQGSVSPSSVEGLKSGQTAFFEATYLITGGNTEKIIFNATIANAAQGNFETDISMIIIPTISESAINEVLGGQVGVISMNFTSFEACIPADDNCFSDSSDWVFAWNLTKATKYIFRLNFTNNGAYPLIVEQATHNLGIATKSGGGGNPPTPFFIHADSTPTDEDGGPYTDLSKILPANANVTTAIYFGSANPGGTPLQKTDTNGIVVSVLIVLFGYEDRDGSGGLSTGDTNYGQTIPFQAYRLHD